MSNQKSGPIVKSTTEKSQSLGSLKKKTFESRIPSLVSSKPSSLTQLRARPLQKKELIKLYREDNTGDTLPLKAESAVKLPNNSGDAKPAKDDIIKENNKEETKEVVTETKIKEENSPSCIEEPDMIVTLSEVSSSETEECVVTDNCDTAQSIPEDAHNVQEVRTKEVGEIVRTSYEDILAIFESKTSANNSSKKKADICKVKLHSSSILKLNEQNQSEIAKPHKTISSTRNLDKCSSSSKDSEILADLQKADSQATNTVKTVEELKRRLGELQRKERMTDEDNNELQEINNQMKIELGQLEKITKKVQELVGLENMSTTEFKKINFISPPSLPSAPFSPPDSDSYVSNTTSSTDCLFLKNNFNNKINSSNQSTSNVTSVTSRDNVRSDNTHKDTFNIPDPHIPVITRQLRESYNMQEKLAADNVDLEGEKYKLQEELLKKDQACDILQNKLTALENEMRLVSKENVSLSERLSKFTCQDDDQISSMDACDRTCSSKMECELLMYKNNTSMLEEQMLVMKNEINCLQIELLQVYKERQQLDNLKKCNCTSTEHFNNNELVQLREKYKQLKEDYEAKEEEAERYVANIQKLTNTINQERNLYYQDMDCLRELEEKAHCQYNSQHEKMVSDLEQELNSVKEILKECQEELDQQIIINDDQKAEMNEYKSKYLANEKLVEEQRREIDVLRLENSEITERINAEVQKARNTFNEKMKSITQLPFIIEDMEIKLQEANQSKEAAETVAESIAFEFHAYKEKANMFGKDMENISMFHQEAVKDDLVKNVIENECSYLKQENLLLRTAADITAQKEKRLEAKIQETMNLARHLESVLEKSSTNVSQVKDKNDLARKKLQSQIMELETNLAQTRAAAASAQNESDEMRVRMQSQINILNNNFEDAKMRIQQLQEHVSYLKKSTSTNLGSHDLDDDDDLSLAYI